MWHRTAKSRLMAALRREVHDQRVLQAVDKVPRDAFIEREYSPLAYQNIPLPIGGGQTISQPLMVAVMLQALSLQPTDRVLEVGTGSGYEAALLSLLAREVVTVERLPLLEARARETLHRLHYDNVTVLPSGPVLGCPERAPYDAIVVAAAAPSVPPELVEQLAVGGRLVLPVGSRYEQTALRVVRQDHGEEVTSLGPCRFVPLIGAGAWAENADIRDVEAGRALHPQPTNAEDGER